MIDPSWPDHEGKPLAHLFFSFAHQLHRSSNLHVLQGKGADTPTFPVEEGGWPRHGSKLGKIGTSNCPVYGNRWHAAGCIRSTSPPNWKAKWQPSPRPSKLVCCISICLLRCSSLATLLPPSSSPPRSIRPRWNCLGVDSVTSHPSWDQHTPPKCMLELKGGVQYMVCVYNALPETATAPTTAPSQRLSTFNRLLKRNPKTNQQDLDGPSRSWDRKRCMQLPNHPAPRQQIITTAPGTDSAQNSNTQHKHLGTKFHSYEKQKQQLLKLGEWAAWKIQGGTVVARRLHSVWAHHAPRRPQSLGCYSLNRASWNRSCTVERNSRNSGWVKPWE